MNSTSLRQLIKESIQEYIREVETSGNVAAQEAKIRACDEAIVLREKKLNMEGLDEAYHDMIDEAKKKNLEKEIKELQKYKKKAEKILEKMKSKAEGKTTKKVEDEVTEEEGIIDEVSIDEMDPEAGPQLEEAKKKKKKEEKEQMNESFLYMQKLAGVITEAEYKAKVEEISLSGMANKVKDKITNLPQFQKLIDTLVSNMDEKDIATFKSKFNLSEDQGGPSFEDILSKVDNANPDADNQETINEALDSESFSGKIVNLIRNLTGINLLALGGAPLGILITVLAGWSWAALPLGIFISLVVSLIIHGISSKLLGRSGNDDMVGD